MRFETTKREIESSGTMEVSVAKIKATAKLFDMFANDTYADKPVAILRELVANGVDAHVASGKRATPVEVYLPTGLDPTCRVRDYGTGMSHDFVMGPFMEYTNGSTKDNDNNAIGGFGIGSKSPFAYVDQYTLRSVHDGILSIYTMFKNEDSLPAIGLQAQTTTDEPNGVEVSFPVEDTDMETFRKAAQQALQYFNPLPTVVNGTVVGPNYTYVGTDWAMRKEAGELGVILGGIRYPVSKGSLEWSVQKDAKINALIDYGLDITLPIGACGVAMSREALQYMPKTSSSISAALHGILEDVVKTFANYFDNCSSEWEAMARLRNEVGTSSWNRSGRAQLLLANAKYHGKDIETGFRLDDKVIPDAKVWAIPAKSSRRGKLCPPPKWGPPSDVYTITPADVEMIIIDDLPQNAKSKTIRKIKEFVNGQSQAKNIYVFRGRNGNAHDVKAFIPYLRGPTDVTYTSTLPEPQAAPKAAKSERPRVRMFTFNGANDKFTHRPIKNLSPSRSKASAVSEIKYADQPDKGIMVIMNSFDLPNDFHKKMETKLVAYSDLVFVNVVDAPRLKDKFLNFEDVFQKRLDGALAAYPDLPMRLAVAANPLMQDFLHLWKNKLEGKLTLSEPQKKRGFGKIVALYNTYVRPLTENQQLLAPFVTTKLPKGVDPTKLIADIPEDVKILLKVLNLREPSHIRVLAKGL